MKPTIKLILLLLAAQSYAQQKEVKVKLADDLTLTLVKDTFNPKGKAIELADDVVISIDKKLLFGTDGEMPRTYLKKATLTIDAQSFDLQVDGMYDPWLGNLLHHVEDVGGVEDFYFLIGS